MIRSIGLISLMAILFTFELPAQSLPGLTGYLNIPSADMQKDGTFYMGANYLDKHYINYYADGKYNCLIYYFDLTFLPFIEVNYRNTRVLDYHGNTATVDRMFSGRLRIIKERKIWPSIVVGAHDVYTGASNGTNQWFGATYIVITKNFNINDYILGGTLGYAYPIYKHNQFSGVFGGISLKPAFLPQLALMAEYDSKYFNVGASFLFFKHLYVFAVLQGMERLSGGAAFRVSAFSGFKKKNKEQGLP